MTRKNVPSRVRFEVLRRDGFRCRYCGAPAPETGEGLTVDHVVPVVLGGTNDPSNLVAACRDCNSGKSSATPDAAHVADVADDAMRWSAAMRMAAEEMALEAEPERAAVAAVDEAWGRWKVDGDSVYRPSDWPSTIRGLMHAGLTASDMVELVDVAMGSKAATGNKWRYFAGCGWRRVEELQRRAKVILGTETPARPVVTKAPHQWPAEEDEDSSHLDAAYWFAVELWSAGLPRQEAIRAALAIHRPEDTRPLAAAFAAGWNDAAARGGGEPIDVAYEADVNDEIHAPYMAAWDIGKMLRVARVGRDVVEEVVGRLEADEESIRFAEAVLFGWEQARPLCPG